MMTNRVLEEPVLLQLGMSPASSALIQKLLQQARSTGVDTNNNTFLKETIEPNLPTEERDTFWSIARAPYSLNLPSVLHTGIVGQKDFRGDKILEALNQMSHGVGDIQVYTPDTSLPPTEKMTAEITNALVCWLFSSNVLENMTPEELAAARSTSERELYLTALDGEVSEHTPESWNSYITAFEKYFSDAASTVFEMWMRENKLDVEPIPGAVLVTSDGAIHIRPPEGYVLMSGVSEKLTVETAKCVVVVGREITVPESAFVQ